MYNSYMSTWATATSEWKESPEGVQSRDDYFSRMEELGERAHELHRRIEGLNKEISELSNQARNG